MPVSCVGPRPTYWQEKSLARQRQSGSSAPHAFKLAGVASVNSKNLAVSLLVMFSLAVLCDPTHSFPEDDTHAYFPNPTSVPP